MRYQGMVIRPPSEAYSYILQVTYGCSHNACTFCATYRGTRHQPRPLQEIYEDIGMAAEALPRTSRVFLADGDAMGRDTGELLEILSRLGQAFPNLDRVGVYANAKDLLAKTPEELKELSRARLGIFYLGLESGDDEVLKRVRKGADRRPDGGSGAQGAERRHGRIGNRPARPGGTSRFTETCGAFG